MYIKNMLIKYCELKIVMSILECVWKYTSAIIKFYMRINKLQIFSTTESENIISCDINSACHEVIKNVDVTFQKHVTCFEMQKRLYVFLTYFLCSLVVCVEHICKSLSLYIDFLIIFDPLIAYFMQNQYSCFSLFLSHNRLV